MIHNTTNNGDQPYPDDVDGFSPNVKTVDVDSMHLQRTPDEGAGEAHEAQNPTPVAKAAISAENLQAHDDPDPFPPEGTDDKMVQSADTGETPLTNREAISATLGALALGLFGNCVVSGE